MKPDLLKKLYRISKLLVTHPKYLNVLLDYDPLWEKKAAAYQFPKGLPVVPLNQLISAQDMVVEPFAFLDGGSLPTDLALLSGLANQIPNCRYFEIGTWRGESVANVARFANECYTLNLSPQELSNLGHNNDYIQAHAYFSKNLKNVTHLHGNSLSYDFSSIYKKFDLIFIDGEHHYSYVKSDTQRVFAELVHENSIVVWHDYAKDPEHPRFEVLAGILDGLPTVSHQNIYHVENTLCAIYIKKPISSTLLNYPSKSNNLFSINIHQKAE